MNTRNKLIVTGAAAVVLLTLAVTALKDQSSTAVTPAARGFSSRFQPTPDILAGIGSTRDLKPVPLGNPAALAPLARGQASTDRGHHVPAGTQR